MATREASRPGQRAGVQRSLIRRVGFRFTVAYLGLYSFAMQFAGGLILFPNFSFPSLGTVWPMRDITIWLATHVFHVQSLVYAGTSADTAFHWVQTFWLLIAAAIVAAIWSVVRLKADATDSTGDAVRKWVHLFFRFALAGQMFYFGMAKVIPTQFPPPALVTLVKPVGDLSPTDLLWTFIGASTPYQMFTGWAEVVAGALLVVPKTAVVGAIIALADMVQVFVLNMSYDIGLKQISFHLILISLFVLAPEAQRLLQALVLDRPRTDRRALIAQIVFGVYLLAMFTRLAIVSYSGPGGPGSPRSPLYGIWDVRRMSVDGEVRPPFQYDYDRRWRRVIFDEPDFVAFERTDESFLHYGTSIDADSRTITMRKSGSRTWRASLRFARPTGDAMVLDGEIDGHVVHAELERVGMDVFKLLNGGFRWVRPPG